mmetsp:Transcript_30537/g.99728  ORF Transcript_30537/g.99728 Transcript_30537/m.99728 type:complete len:377 (-) Transcript_30537:2849-3979(-)
MALDAALRQVLVYQDKVRLRSDSMTLIQAFPHLSAGAEMFVHNDGTSNNLLRFAGTVPVPYRGSTYNIPVCIWVMESYPARPPLPIVTPTSDMIITPKHRHVDMEGKVYLPYLNQWNARTCNLVEMAHAMISVFSMDPPVRARPAAAPAPPMSTYTPPYPGAAPAPAPAPPPPPVRHSPALGSAATASSGSSSGESKEVLARKVTASLQEEVYRQLRDITDAIDIQFQTQHELEDRKRARTGKKEEVEAACKRLEDALMSLKEQRVMVSSWLEAHSEAEAERMVDPDDLVLPEDAHARQMLDAVPRVAAVEDALYHVERALANGQLDVDSFVKLVRKLARTQFMDKALVRAITEMQTAAAQQARAPAAYGHVRYGK